VRSPRKAPTAAGFRSSHAEALQAARIAGLAPATAGPVTDYPRVELLSLLATDLPRARAFVARQLGPLASPDEPAERLRETVLAFLAAGGSATRVANELYVHQNTWPTASSAPRTCWAGASPRARSS
jgi:DNA-binding PucR family transcriptional regulator